MQRKSGSKLINPQDSHGNISERKRVENKAKKCGKVENTKGKRL